MTRAALAQAAAISPALIQKIEQGSRTPTQDALAALFDALEVPPTIRDHIVGLTLPARLTAALDDEAGVVTPADLAVLQSIPHPACFQSQPEFDVLAVNAAWTRWFPGCDPGVNIIEWMMLHPAARAALPQWRRQAHLMVYAFRIMGPGLVPPERIAELVGSCERAPEWAELWTTEVPPREIPRPIVAVNDPDTGRPCEMYAANLKFDFPRRRWWMYSLVPAHPPEVTPTRDPDPRPGPDRVSPAPSPVRTGPCAP
ncbi:helix-turn-helix domain-containing protein [Nocardia higoensis]|uniref:Helix-turn-helix domain-containing protein n=2 Tax=Nocardia higoensis TaxID=228599 RepID=A0ABS0D410_9NOCA|nr:helix-turn-helix domain-containing protein [Nocardia higoensis]